MLVHEIGGLPVQAQRGGGWPARLCGGLLLNQDDLRGKCLMPTQRHEKATQLAADNGVLAGKRTRLLQVAGDLPAALFVYPEGLPATDLLTGAFWAWRALARTAGVVGWTGS
jgi:hypothetical protein